MDVCRSEKIKQLFDKMGINAKKLDEKYAKAEQKKSSPKK